MSDQNIFTQEPAQATPEAAPAANPLDQFVGEGKKFATIDDFVKGYATAQQFIEHIKNENKELREDLNAQLTFNERFEQLQRNAEQRKQEQVQPPAQQPQVATPGQPAIQEDDLVTKVREITRREREEEQRRNNVETVSKKLVEVYGDTQKANAAMRNKADELGVPLEWLMDSAARSPRAFYQTIGLDQEAPRQAAAPRSEVNPLALSKTGTSEAKPGTYAYYRQLRRENPRLYHTPKIQLEMHNKAQELGDAFYAE